MAQVARTYAQAVLQMIVINGRFHADPHPGNILIKTDGTVIFIDFGAVGTLLPHRRDELVDLSLAIAGEDTATLARILLRWAGDPPVDREALARALAGLIDRFKASVLDQIDLGEVFSDVFRLLREFELSLPPDLALMLRTLLTAEGFVRRIDPRFDIGAELAPIARKLLRERVGFGELRDKARRTAALLGRAVLNAPELVSELEKIVRSGRLPISLDRRDLEFLVSGGRHRPLAGHHVISAALIIAAAILSEGQPTLAGACAFLSTAIIAVGWFRRK
jgi:ubiquinone biosynthesis protein